MKHRRFLHTILVFGALWGLTEATIGYALHTLPRVIDAPNIAGAVMFPIALMFMVGAIRRTGRSSAAMGAAVVAAMIKVSSLTLPVVRFAFVRSPVLAILAEGAVVTAVGMAGLIPFTFAATGKRQTATIFLTALGLSVIWRGLFLGLNVVLGVTGGILSKPAGMIMQFLTLESLWNAGVITVAVFLANRQDEPAHDERRPANLREHWNVVGPLWTTVLLFSAFAAEWGSAYLPI